MREPRPEGVTDAPRVDEPLVLRGATKLKALAVVIREPGPLGRALRIRDREQFRFVGGGERSLKGGVTHFDAESGHGRSASDQEKTGVADSSFVGTFMTSISLSRQNVCVSMMNAS